MTCLVFAAWFWVPCYPCLQDSFVCAGEITSRLSADTTTVSDQICLNLNVGLRSLTQAAMVLVFMFKASWRLTIITFIVIPLIILVCKVYGAYYRWGSPSPNPA